MGFSPPRRDRRRCAVAATLAALSAVLGAGGASGADSSQIGSRGADESAAFATGAAAPAALSEGGGEESGEGERGGEGEREEGRASGEAEDDGARADPGLSGLSEELDEAFRDWGELEEEDPRDVDEEPEVDPRADMPPAFYGAETWPKREVERPLALGPGMVEIRATARASLAAGAAFDPVSVAPDVLFGASERLTLGITHTRQAALATPAEEVEEGVEDDDGEEEVAALGISASPAPAARAGDGICLGDRCTGAYDNIGVTARLALGAMRGPLQLRVHAGLEGATVWPLRAGGRAGVTGRFTLGRAAAIVDGSFRVGLFRRGPGNEDVVSIPVTLQFQASRRVALELSSGAYGMLTEGLSELRLPLMAGFLAAVSPSIDVGARAGFPLLVGGDPPPGTDEREFGLVFVYRL